jgi:hypothetical protein
MASGLFGSGPDPCLQPEQPLDFLPHRQRQEQARNEQQDDDGRKAQRCQPALALTVLARTPLRAFHPVGTADGTGIDRHVLFGLDPCWLGHETAV